MKREKNNNLVNQNLIEMMEESTTNKNIQRAVNPCGCIYIYTFSLNEYKNNQLNLITSSHNLWALLSVAK